MTSRSRTRRAASLVLLSALIAGALATQAAAGSRRLLPNLVPLVPVELFPPRTDVMPFSTTTAVPVVVEGCLPEEIARTGASRCLRFDTRIANTGRGPLEIAYRVAGPEVLAMQRIFHKDGAFEERRATTSEYHATHTHFHIKDFYISRLWKTDRDGRALGKPVATTLKNGFCPQDSSPYGSGTEPRYGCRSEWETEEGISQIVGISAGWMDVYGFNLPDQFLEVSALEPGRYLLQTTIDPNRDFVESNENDNSVCVELRLGADTAKVSDPDANCPRL